MTDPRKIGFHLEKDEDGYPPTENEWLWANLGADGWIIDNIPRYAGDVSLHDTVAVKSDDDRQLWFAGAVGRSDHSTLRVLPQARDAEPVAELRRRLEELGCTSEQFSTELPMLAVDVPAEADITSVVAFLDEGEVQGTWGWETGFLSDLHRSRWPT